MVRTRIFSGASFWRGPCLALLLGSALTAALHFTSPTSGAGTQRKTKTKTKTPKVSAQRNTFGHRALHLPPLQANLPVFDVVRDYSAKGDGETDDTQAFARLTADVNRRGGGVKIVVPPGTYRVGGQTLNGRNPDGQTYRFDGRDGMLFRGCTKPIVVEGTGAILRLPDGLRFGAFDANGDRLDPTLPFYDTRAAATTGFMIGGVACADIRINGLELDGRNTSYILGGAWGDRERQTRSYGFYFDNCLNVGLTNSSAHNFGLDGIYIKAPGLQAAATARPHILRNCRFEWNNRQGLSWSGGIGLRASNCVFAHTGYAINERTKEQMWSAPGAGVDIEAELAVNRDGVFENCEFVHTRGPALYAEVGDNADVLFQNCRFWNFQYYSLLPKSPRMVFSECEIYGAAISAYTSRAKPSDATRFLRCTFEDKPHPEYGQPFVDAYGSLFAFDYLQAGLRLEDCRFIAHRVKGPLIRQNDPKLPLGFTLSGGTMVLEHFDGPGESVATLQGGLISGLRVQTNFKRAAPPGLHVWTNGQNRIGQDGVEVVGPNIRWRAPDGEVGKLAPSPQ